MSPDRAVTGQPSATTGAGKAASRAVKTVQHTRFPRLPAAAQTHVENSDVISTESVDILPFPVRKPRSVRHRTGLPKI
ncbi:hypothetical protein MKD38_05185 [Cupriavidus sp. WGlv3]|uniref:hypothetical protein n=1 Tax=Cupriavidus sp. WGlv3 TaxID=2919924 RepID=UPI0020914091|nr:hypothetical protein [Cupriavidus sp. WGlv3]MCO4861054.1 hypothetical protein [Cupriavidus sp. WGlv3]